MHDFLMEFLFYFVCIIVVAPVAYVVLAGLFPCLARIMNSKLQKTIDDQQRQIDNLKRELEEMKRKK